MEITHEWIDNFHRKTIKFIGGFEKFEDFEGKERYIERATGNTWLLEELDFINDWNWIMEVVEKIEHTECDNQGNLFVFNISKSASFITSDVIGCVFKPLTVHYGKKLHCVIKTIDQFIDWYNKQKENETETNKTQ